MDEASIIQYITGNFDGIDTFTSTTGNTFFFYDPDHMFPMATLVTNDEYDQFSDLNRPSIFRLNIGISKETFRSLFGTEKLIFDQNDYDFTAIDQVMPHPVYSNMYWVCLFSPKTETFETSVQPLLAEAYDIAVRKYSKKVAGGRP